MNQSFYTSVSGAKSYQSAIDVTGTNIAHVNTTGYRGSTAEFSNIFSKTYSENSQTTANDLGYGSTISTTAIDMQEGSYQGTDNTFDLAISGEGWFGVSSKNIYDGREAGYTRNGVFSVDANSELVNTSGNYVLGTNYNNISTVNGQNVINVDVAEPNVSVANQSKLFLPNNLIYPAVASTEISLATNLDGDNTSFNDASSSSNLVAAYTQENKALNLVDGEDVIFNVGNHNVSSSSGSLNMNLTFSDEIADGSNSQLFFTLNNQDISVNIPDGATKEEIATLVAAQITTAEIADLAINTSTDGITLSSTSSVTISNSSHPSILEDGSAVLAIFQRSVTSANGFSNLEDIRNIINNQINATNPNLADVSIDTKGSLKISSNDIFDFKVQNTDNSNDNLLSMLNGLTSSYTSDSDRTSFAFQTKSKDLNSYVITPDGGKKDVKLEFSQIDKGNEFNGDTWEVNATVYEKNSLFSDSDLATIIYQNNSSTLESGDDIWIRGGNIAPAIIDDSYGYQFTLADDILNGKSSSLSFTINNQELSLSILDGTSKDTIANNLKTVLENSGFSAEIDAFDNVIVHPQDDKLVITNGTSTLSGVAIEDFAVQRLVYDENGNSGFKTTDDFLSQMNETLGDVSLQATIDNGKIVMRNNSLEENFFSFLSGANSDDSFFNSISSLGGSMFANSSTSSNPIETMNVLSSDSQTLQFQEDGSLSEASSLTLNNMGEDVSIDLGDIISSSGNNSLSDKIFQNGNIQGGFNGYSVGNDGKISASFDNGMSSTVGKVSVFHFQNDQGLERIGDNLFKSSNNSGNPIFYYDNNGDIIDSSIIRQKTLENSNVSTSRALTELILYQRSFEGASKAITTSDQMIQKAINMKN